jgi:hypothetical protein
MNGDPYADISEHAFGNALDMAAFTLSHGREVTVKDGWHGAPRSRASCTPGRGLRDVHHCVAAGLQSLPLRPHARGPDAKPKLVCEPAAGQHRNQ